jgi:hypothetical protein
VAHTLVEEEDTTDMKVVSPGVAEARARTTTMAKKTTTVMETMISKLVAQGTTSTQDAHRTLTLTAITKANGGRDPGLRHKGTTMVVSISSKTMSTCPWSRRTKSLHRLNRQRHYGPNGRLRIVHGSTGMFIFRKMVS